MALAETNTNSEICEILGWASALFSAADIDIAAFQQLNNCSCPKQ
jgi:hypothetical protein